MKNKTYAIVNTCTGRCNRNLSALEVLERLGYRVELAALMDEETGEESEAWLVGRLNYKQHRQDGVNSAEEAAEKYLDSRLGESRITEFSETSLDSCVMPEGDADDFINRYCLGDAKHENEIGSSF